MYLTSGIVGLLFCLSVDISFQLVYFNLCGGNWLYEFIGISQCDTMELCRAKGSFSKVSFWSKTWILFSIGGRGFRSCPIITVFQVMWWTRVSRQFLNPPLIVIRFGLKPRYYTNLPRLGGPRKRCSIFENQ